MQPIPQQQTTVVTGDGVFVTGPGNPTVGYVTVQQPTIPVTVPSSVAESYKHRQSVGLGVTLIVIGSLSMIFNIVALCVSDYLSYVGHGFWIGGLFIITGGFGVGAKNKNRCMIVTFMIMCIFSAIFTIPLLGFGIGGAVNNSYCGSYYYYYYYYYCNRTGTAMEVLQAILAVAAAIVSIWGSAICCHGVCCCTTSPATYGMVATPYGQQQVTVVTQQQSYGVQYPAAPYMAQPTGFYQPPLPQQQTWIPPAQQPMQPGIHGQMQTQQGAYPPGVYPSAPVYTSYGAQGFAPMAPPSYAVSEAQKNQISPGGM